MGSGVGSTCSLSTGFSISSISTIGDETSFGSITISSSTISTTFIIFSLKRKPHGSHPGASKKQKTYWWPPYMRWTCHRTCVAYAFHPSVSYTHILVSTSSVSKKKTDHPKVHCSQSEPSLASGPGIELAIGFAHPPCRRQKLIRKLVSRVSYRAMYG